MDLKMALRVERVLEEVVLGLVKLKELDAEVEVIDTGYKVTVAISLEEKEEKDEAEISGSKGD